MILGLSGHANSGKDTLADFFAMYPPYFEKRAFAAKLKHIARILTGWGDQYTREGKAHWLEDWSMTVGTFQQKLGTEAVRNGIKDNAWILALFSDYTPNQRWCITDVRFPNEAEAVRSRGGILIRINRDVMDDCGRDIKHLSEIALDDWNDWDFMVDNNGTLEELEMQAKMILERIHHDRGV